MRILVVSSYPPRHCGIGMYARDQIAGFRAEGSEVTVLSPPDGDGDIRVPFPGGRAFLRAARIGRRFDRIVLHFQPALYFRPRRPLSKLLTSLTLLWLTLRRRQLEIVVHEADRPVRWRPDYLLLGLAFRAAKAVCFHTRSEWQALERDYGIRVRGTVVQHRVAADARLSREGARRALGIAESGPILLCAGFLQRSKGFDRAVRAFAGAKDGGRLYVVGSVRDATTENEAFARELRERSNATPGVTFMERFMPDEEFDRWVAAADWVVLPYRRSWSSGVLARAQALGTPAIISRVGGLAEQAGRHDVVVEGDEGLRRAVREAAAGGAGRSRILEEGEASATERSVNDPIAAGLAAGVDAGATEPARRQHQSDWDPFYEPPAAETDRRKGRTMLLGLIVVSVLLAALAQLTLKHAMNQVSNHGASPLSLSHPGVTVVRIASQPLVWVGLATFAASAGIWLIVLSRASLSFAYPFASLTYVMILLFDRFVLHDEVSALRWGGVGLIIGGLLLVSRTPHS
jgi:glycosyltransferase involved in cell wall biosynthesis